MDPYIRNYENNLPSAVIVNSVGDFKKQIASYNFKIYHMNVRSVAKNIDKLFIFLHQLTTDFDVIILTETRQIDDHHIYNINGYTTFYNHGKLNQNDGIIAFVKNTLEVNMTIIKLGDVTAMKLLIKEKFNVSIMAIYRSPSTCVKKINLDLLSYLQNSEKCDLDVITGDMNINLLDDCSDTEEYKNIMSCFDYVSYINDNTRMPSYTCLDHFFIRQKGNIGDINLKSFIFRYYITDHSPIVFSFKIENCQHNVPTNKNYKTFTDYNKLKNDLIKEDWESVYQGQNMHNKVSKFIEILQSHIKNNTKTVHMKRKKNLF